MTLAEELELRRRQLAARKDKPGWKANCEALAKRIQELEERLQNGERA